MQVNVRQRIFTAASLVGKTDMVKINGAVGHFFHRLLRGRQVGSFVENLTDTAYAGHGHGDHNYHHGQHHETHQQGHDVAEKTGEIAGAHFSGYNELGSKLGSADNTEVYR